MSEDTIYSDADIVWVKLGNSWWPGEVCGQQRQPEGFLQLAKRKPYCVVKFFQEDTFEYVKSSKHILPFNCSKKDEFIRKGHELFKAKKKFMEKFPSDVSTAERLTRSVTRSTLFFNSRPDSIVKAILGQSPQKSDLMRNGGGRCDNVTKIINLTPNRITETRSLPISPATYKCSLCDFQSTRQNVMVLHRKTHSNTPATSRSSLVNSSTNTSIEIDSSHRPVSQTMSVGISPTPTKSIGRKTPDIRKATSIQSNDTVITVDDESECSSDVNILEQTKASKSSVAEGKKELSVPKNDTIIVVQDSQVHTNKETVNVVVNKVGVCKSVEIQKSLLADWMDEDKDDEEDEPMPGERKIDTSNKAILELSERNANSALTISAPTSPELLKGVDLTYIGETSSSSDSSKPSTRIRNIPKKDRRNINFTEFNIDEKVTNSIEVPNKTNTVSELTNKDLLPLIDLVDDSSNETVLKQHDVLPTTEKNTSKMNSCEGDMLVEGTVLDNTTVKTNLIEQNTYISAPQDITMLNQSLSKTPTESVERKISLSPTDSPVCIEETPTVATECVAEPITRIESNEAPLQNASSALDSPDCETSCLQTSTEEAFEELNCIRRKSLEQISTKNLTPKEKSITEHSENTSNRMKSISEKIDSNRHYESFVEEEQAPTDSHCELIEQLNIISVDKDTTSEFCPVKESSEKNVEIQESLIEQSEVEIMTNEIHNLEADAIKNSAVSLNTDTTDEIHKLEFPLGENIDVQSSADVQLENEPLTNESSPADSDEVNTTTLNTAKDAQTSAVPESCSSHSTDKSVDIIGLPIQEIIMEESISEKQNALNLKNDDVTISDETSTRTLPLIGIQSDVSPDKCIISENDKPTNPLSCSASVMSFTSEVPVLELSEGEPALMEECTTQLNVETLNNHIVLEEKCDKEEDTSITKSFGAITSMESEIGNNNEIPEPKISLSVTKSSLSCFDFEEEEDNDILTSIAKFKKKNISLEKHTDFGKENRPKTPDEQKIERELKDKQLSAEIESLLRTTEMLVPTTSSATAEVRGLPIKERGKRIFKSRNRFKVESCQSITTTLALKKFGSTSPEKKEEEITTHSSVRPSEPKPELHNPEVVNKESDKAPDPMNIEEPAVEKMNFEEHIAMDDKVTNSEEEIVGRVVFSPAEVYAPFPETSVIDYSENKDAQVTSSGMEIVTEPLPESDENAQENTIVKSAKNVSIQEKNLQNCSNDENLEVVEDVRYEGENEQYYEVVEEVQLEAIVQFTQPKVVENQIPSDDIEEIQQEAHDQLNEFYVVEESEPVYEEEVSYEDISNKTIDPAYENSNEYELITTEVSSIVDRIASDENSQECDSAMTEEIAKVSYTLEAETEICDGEPSNIELNKRLSTGDLVLYSTTDNAVVDSQCTIVEEETHFVPSTQSDNTVLSEESNTCFTVENNSKSSYNDKEINNDDKHVESQVERTEASSDDNSTIISEAEAEFGSPTSMLEEDRVLKRARRGSETSTTTIECPKSLHRYRSQKNEVAASREHLCRKDHVFSQQSLQSDTNESCSNDLQSSSPNINYSEKEIEKENVDNVILRVIQKELLKIKEKEDTEGVEVLSINEEHLSELNAETDSCDEDDEEEEEEISSPPIEPIQDERFVEENADTSISTNSSMEFSNKDQENTTIREKESIDAAGGLLIQEVELLKGEKILQNHTLSKLKGNGESISSFYSLTQNTETVIKLNKNKEMLTDSMEKTSLHVVEKKSDIAGEELSAAEALLSIPNQPGSNLGDSNDLSTLSTISVESPQEENENISITESEVKDEPMDSSDLPSKLQDHIPKELVRRKGRSHMKVTPRKRIIDSGYSDTPSKQELNAKIPKLTKDSKPSNSKPALKNDCLEHQTKINETEEKLVEVVTINKIDSEKSEKQTPEKVHITVDISNPLSSQIANILGTMDSSDGITKNGAQKRKQTLEDDITSFIIKKPSPTTDAEAEAADRETIAQIQNLCPQVEITRKSSKDEQTSTQTSKPLILNNQMLRTGNNQPIITVTPKSKKTEEAFDINNMPIVFNENVVNEKVHLVITPTSNPQIIKQFQNQQQLVLGQRPDSRSFTSSPINVTNPRITTRRQSNLRTKRTPTRQQIQEQNSQKQQEVQQKSNHPNKEGNHQPHILQQHYNPQPQINIHDQQQQPQPTQLQQHKRQQQFRSNQQVQLHNQHTPAQFQNQFQLHQQQKIQQQLHEEQTILIQQQQQQHQQQMMIQQQIQMQQHQQRQEQLREQQQQEQQRQQQQQQQQQKQQQQQQHHQQQQILIQQQLLPVEKNSNLNTSDKQMGVDARGKKYVIIKAPPNTVVMDNNSEIAKAGVQHIQQSHAQNMPQQKNISAQRKQRQPANGNKKQLSHQIVQPLPIQTIPNMKPLNQTSTITHLPTSSLPHMTPVSHHPVHTSPNVSYANEVQRYFKEQQAPQLYTPTLPSLPVMPAKGKGSGRGRRAKQVVPTVVSTIVPALPTIENTPKNVKSNTNGRRTTGSYCEPPRQRTTRSTAAKKNNSILSTNEGQSSLTSELTSTATVYQSPIQSTQKVMHIPTSQCIVNTVNSVGTISSAIANSAPMKGQPLGSKSGVIADIPIEKSRGSGGCYAVPASPVPGFPHTFLVCELIDNKYREAYEKLLYLSPDGSRLCEIPDELVTEAHRKLRDDQREPNPDYIQIQSGALQMDKSIRIQMSEQQKLQPDGKMENNEKSNEVFMQKHNSLTVEEQASALLCLQEQMVQEQLAQEQLVQKQFVQEHLSHEQLVQEQLVQEQLVQEQFVQEHFVQDQFGREQFVQEQFVQEQFVPEQFVQEQITQEQIVRDQFMQHHQLKGDQNILRVTHSIENDEAHDSIIQHLEPDTVVMDGPVDTSNAVVLNIGSQQLILDHTAFINMVGENNTEGISPGGNIFTMTQEGLQELLNSYNSSRNETSAMVFTGDGCEQRVMMNENILHTDDNSPDGLRIALNDPRLYAEEQFINPGSILQIETPDGLRLISTAPGNSGIVIQSMPPEAKACDANILNQSHKSSPAHEENHSDNIKSKFEGDPSATTLDDCLNVIGVSAQSPSVPTSLELSHSEIVTKNRGPSPGTIAMNEIVATGLCHHPDITSLPSMGSNEQDIHYGFFTSNTSSHNDKVNANGESVVADMDEYAVGSSGGNFDDPGR